MSWFSFVWAPPWAPLDPWVGPLDPWVVTIGFPGLPPWAPLDPWVVTGPLGGYWTPG